MEHATHQMLIAVLGTHASASTWTFNALRLMLAAAHPDAVSLFAERGHELLDNLPLGIKNVLIKCHSADRALLEFLTVSGAKVIATARNPCDVVASQVERFDVQPRDAAGKLTKSTASIAMALEIGGPLVMHYEDGFAENPGTLRRLAQWIGLNIGDNHLTAIHESLRSDIVKERLKEWSEETAAKRVHTFTSGGDL